MGLIIAVLMMLLLVLPSKVPIRDNGASTIPADSKFTGISDLLSVNAPSAGDLVKSPLTIRGEARGNWYFEASFPVKLFDGNGKLLSQVPASAVGEWMTKQFVPFEAILAFEIPQTATGTLIFQKDNPSGLPQNDRQFEMAVRFK